MGPRTSSGKGKDRPITPELVRDALSFISPDIGHDDRARVAFAVWDGLGDGGRDVWMDWAGSRAGADHSEDDSTWKSARKPGKVRVGTLFGMAKDRGFTWPDAADYVPPDPAVLAAQAEKRERERKLAAAQYRERADQAQRVARGLWSEAERDGVPSPYLQRKGVQAYGLRTMPDGTLLVPMRNAAGELQNVQRIAPVKPPADSPVPEKRYLPGGRKQGLLHLIGGAGVCTRDGEPVPVLLLAEGYATAASLHEATGRPVAVCFDAGNLKAVAIELREVYPDALMVMCGDDDTGTEAEKGRNPGRKAAESAMRAAITDTGWAMVVMPTGLPEGGTDFNDLHMHAGLDEVRKQLAYEITCELMGLTAKAEAASATAPDAAAEPLSDFERDCLAGEGAASWDVADAVSDAAAAGASSPPPSPDAAAPRAPTPGEGATVLEFPASKRRSKPKAKDPAEDAALQEALRRKHESLMAKVRHLTERFAFVYSTEGAWDRQTERLVKVKAMRLAFGNEPVAMWLARPSRCMVMPDDLVFEPGREVEDHQINMFTGLELEPVPATADDVAPMLALLRHLCSEAGTADDVDELMHWILRWQALPLQKLGTKMQTAIVMHGAQGTGKNLYWDVWRDLFGVHGITVGQTELEDKFNGWISRKLAIIGDEVVSRQEMYHNKNRLKLVVTQEDKFPIRGMLMETRWESNHANVVFLSNESQPLALEERDRRYLVVYTPLEADAAVYEAVRRFKADGGLAKWLAYLQAYPLDEFGAHTKPLMTQAKADLIELGWRAPERFAHEWLEEMIELPVRVCSSEQLYRAFRRWCDLTGERWPPAQALFTRQVERWVRERVARDAQGRLEPPRLAYKQVALKPPPTARITNRKTVRCWLPGDTGPLPGVTEGEWAHESVQAFEKDLYSYCRQRAVDQDEAK